MFQLIANCYPTLPTLTFRSSVYRFEHKLFDTNYFLREFSIARWNIPDAFFIPGASRSRLQEAECLVTQQQEVTNSKPQQVTQLQKTQQQSRLQHFKKPNVVLMTKLF